VLLEEFSRKLKFDMVGSDSFWISYEYNDPHKAQRAAARLAEEFIRLSIEAKLFAAQSTLTFMEREVKKSKADMEKIENEMAVFTSEHPEYQIDPTTGMPRSPSLGTAPSENFANISNPELRKALTKKGKLEAQLQLLLNPQGNAKVNQARQEVDRAKKRLITLRQQYTDRHPDVQRALIYARQVQTQYNTIIQAQQGNSAGSIARLRDEIASMDQSIARLSARKRPRNETKTAAPATPQVSRKAQLEMRFYQLTRDREVAKAKYDQLYTQLTKSKVSASLERKQAETQFTIVDKANLPRKPSRPSRTKLALGGTALGLMLGLGLAVLLVIFDPRIYSEDDLKKACDLPVLAQIPREA